MFSQKIMKIYAICLLSVLIFKFEKCVGQSVEYNIGLASDKLTTDLKKTLELRKEKIMKLQHEKVINHMRNKAKYIKAQKTAQSWNPELYAGLRRG